MSQYICEFCGEGFDRSDEMARHLAEAHPDASTHAIDIEHAVDDLEYPLGREDLLDRARSAGHHRVVEMLRGLPEQNYRNPREVAQAYNALHGDRDADGDW